MARLRTSKLQQLGGAAALIIYFLFAMAVSTGGRGESMQEDSFLGLLVGAVIAFAAGWFALPALANRIGPKAERRRSERNRRRHEAERRIGRERRSGRDRRAPDAEGPP
jgi:uncharacterized membrane protein YccC